MRKTIIIIEINNGGKPEIPAGAAGLIVLVGGRIISLKKK